MTDVVSDNLGLEETRMLIREGFVIDGLNPMGFLVEISNGKVTRINSNQPFPYPSRDEPKHWNICSRVGPSSNFEYDAF